MKVLRRFLDGEKLLIGRKSWHDETSRIEGSRTFRPARARVLSGKLSRLSEVGRHLQQLHTSILLLATAAGQSQQVGWGLSTP